MLGIEGPFLSELCDRVIDASGDAYPELKTRREMIKKVVAAEEEKFASTIDQGMKIIGEYTADLEKSGDKRSLTVKKRSSSTIRTVFR